MKKIFLVLGLLAIAGLLYSATTTVSTFTKNGTSVQQFTIGIDTNATVYSNALNVQPTSRLSTYPLTVVSVPSAAIGSGDTVRVNLYGSLTSSGTKYKLASDITAGFGNVNGTTPVVGSVNINLYPFPYLYVGYVVTGNEAETKSITLITSAIVN